MSTNLWLGLVSATALAVAIAIFNSKRRRVLGRPRMANGESPLTILRIIGFSLGTWALCVLGLGMVHQIRVKHENLPNATALSEGETVLYGGLLEITVFAVMIGATVSLRPDGIRQTGVNPARFPKGLLGGLLGIIVVLPLIIYVDGLTEWALDHFRQSHPAHELLEILKNNPPAWLRAADVISAGLIAPLAEEMFFRGLLQTFFRNVFNNSWIAIALAAAAFAMVHHWWTWPQIFFLGFCLGYAYERTGNLWVSIAMHALFNLTSIYVFVHLT